MLAHRINSLQGRLVLHSDTLSEFQAKQVITIAPLYCLLSIEEVNTNFKVFWIDPTGREPMIYRTWDEHANHYITDAIHFPSEVHMY